MSATTHLTFEEFQNLPEEEGKRYELDEGELLMTPSPTFLHNRIRFRIARSLAEFVESGGLGEVTLDSDFRLGPNTVLNPDVALLTPAHLGRIDLTSSPVDGAPVLAVEVISPRNRPQDMARKIGHYLGSGRRSVWVIYLKLNSIKVHSVAGVRELESPAVLKDEDVLPGFSLPLAPLFEATKMKG
jgi:Uma2 family endonuclease